MPVRTSTLDAHPSAKPNKGILFDWFQSQKVIRGDLRGRRVRTSTVVRRYRIGKVLYVETRNSIYELRHGLRWGRL